MSHLTVLRDEVGRLQLQGVYMQEANMRGAYMLEANMRGAYMREAYMLGANMREAYMLGAYMQGANMREANMTGVNCQLILRNDGRGYGVHVDHMDDGSRIYRAGCRRFTLDEAREHWDMDSGHESPIHAARILAAIEHYEEGVAKGII